MERFTLWTDLSGLELYREGGTFWALERNTGYGTIPFTVNMKSTRPDGVEQFYIHDISTVNFEVEVIVEVKEKNEMEDTVTISKKEYESLLEKVEFLNCLQACGVDNWDGYSDAHEMMEGEDE